MLSWADEKSVGGKKVRRTEEIGDWNVIALPVRALKSVL
jgi:hypothetical protein